MRIKFDFGDIQAFLAVAELASFQRAADRLNISQSAITRRIQKLESSLQNDLFERTTRSLKLTLQGKIFLPRAQAILDDASEAIQILSNDTSPLLNKRMATINIAAIPTVTHQILPRSVRHFRQQGHTERINILDLFANDVIESVAQGDADFGIGFLGTEEPGLKFNFLLEDKFVLVMHREHHLKPEQQIKWQDITGEEMVLPWKSTGNRMLIDNELARHRLSLGWKYQVHHSSTALGLIEAGVAVAVLPQSSVSNRQNSAVISRPLIDPEITRVIGSIQRIGAILSAPAQAFLQLLISDCHDTSSQ